MLGHDGLESGPFPGAEELEKSLPSSDCLSMPLSRRSCDRGWTSFPELPTGLRASLASAQRLRAVLERPEAVEEVRLVGSEGQKLPPGRATWGVLAPNGCRGC